MPRYKTAPKGAKSPKQPKLTPKGGGERAKRAVPPSSPVSSPPSTPVSRPVARKRNETKAPTPRRTGKPATPKKKDGPYDTTSNAQVTITKEPSGKVVKRYPRGKPDLSTSRPAVKSAKITNPTKGMSSTFKRAYKRYSARHKNVPVGTAMNKVEDLVNSGHKGYTSRQGFKGKGLK